MALQKSLLRKWLVNEPRPEQVVHGWLGAVADRDFERARRYLSDLCFAHTSPISTGANADAYVADISRVGAILESVELRQTFVNGDHVCAIVNYVTHMDKRRVTPVVHLMTVDGDKITSIETFFDARAYAEMFTVEKP